MTDKVLCPWCGSKMEIRVGKTGSFAGGPFIYHGWATCNGENCGAESPIVEDIIVKTEEEAADIIKAAAIRRYEPPIRPLTLEEVERIVFSKDLNDERPMYLEDADGDNGWTSCSLMTYMCRTLRDDYGKTWRYWPRKPTEEERKEAKWNDG